MGRTELALVPEWLRTGGNVNSGGGTPSSLTPTDDIDALQPTRNRPLTSSGGYVLGQQEGRDQATSSYYRRNSNSSSSSHMRSYSSFGRNHRDRDWDKNTYKSFDKPHLEDFADPLDKHFRKRFESGYLRRSRSVVPERCVEKGLKDATDVNQSWHSDRNSSFTKISPTSNMREAALERHFPSLGTEERQATPGIRRIPSPGLSTATQTLPLGTSTMIGGEKWTSALAEVPGIVSNDFGISSVQQVVPSSPFSPMQSPTSRRSMAETVAKSPPRTHITNQMSVGNQKLEELAIKQSRQLIPLTSTTPKALVPNPSDKLKYKIGQQQLTSSDLVADNRCGGYLKSDILKTPSVGKLHVLKLARERNGLSPVVKEGVKASNDKKVANASIAVASSVSLSSNEKIPANMPVCTSAEQKLNMTVGKRPTCQAQSRNDFFNHVRKKSTANSSPISEPGPALSPSMTDGPGKDEKLIAASPASQGEAATLPDNLVGGRPMEDNGDPLDICACDGKEYVNHAKSHSTSDTILYPEEEEAAFLRSLGWEECADEDGGLTEEEINAFYRDVTKYINSKLSSKILQGIEPRFLLPLNSQVGKIGGVSS